MTLSQNLLTIGLLAIIVHAILLARFVTRREPGTGNYAVWVIFFSGMWFIGPFAYFGFRRTKPVLARACLQQLAVVTVLWVVVVVFDIGTGS